MNSEVIVVRLSRLSRLAWRARRWGLLPLLLLLSLVAVARPAHAHGADGTQQLDGVSVGPFALTVWSFPGTLRVGEVHLSASVLRPTDGLPVVNCDVIFHIVPLDEKGAEQTEAILTIQADRANASTGFMHEAIVKLENAGRYRVDVQVIDPNSALDGRATFEVNIQRVSLFYKILVIGLALLTTAIVVWFVNEGRIVWSHRHLIGKEAQAV